MKSTGSRNKNINIPNALSVLRIVLIPFFVYCFWVDEIVIAVILLAISGISDGVDGFVARKFNQITEFGKILDPFADKLTQISIAICFSVKFPTLSPVFIVFLAKEFVMLIFSIRLIRGMKKPTHAKWYGKIATVMFYVSVIAIVIMYQGHIDSDKFFLVANILLVITCAMMIFAGIKYLQIYKTILKSDNEEHKFDIEKELKEKIDTEKRE